MKKTRSQKSRDTVPLNIRKESLQLSHGGLLIEIEVDTIDFKRSARQNYVIEVSPPKKVN
jgi:hypothetical protein